MTISQEKSTINNKEKEFNQKDKINFSANDLQDAIYKLFNDFNDYLELKEELENFKLQKLLKTELKKIYSAYQKLQNNISEIIEFKVKEKTIELELNYKKKLETEISEITKSLKSELIKEYEFDYELKLNKTKKELEQNYIEKLAAYKRDIENLYKTEYSQKKEELTKKLEPEIRNYYETEFQRKKQQFIDEAYSKLEKDYAERLKKEINIAKLEFAIDAAKAVRAQIEKYDLEFKKKVKDELFAEKKEEIMNQLLYEVKIERQKIKEDFEAQFDAERKLLEMQMKQELQQAKQKLKENADKYIAERLNAANIGNIDTSKLDNSATIIFDNKILNNNNLK